MSVFVLDKRQRPLMPCHPARARELLSQGRAVVHRRVPFTIRLKDRVSGVTQPIILGVDPGSRTTGLALAREEAAPAGPVRLALWLGELAHRGPTIRKTLQQRATYRRRRRSANLRYRQPRFANRRRPEGWLAPSLRHRLDTTLTWVRRLRCWVPITRLAVEWVRFDTQQLQHPEISGVEYQQGTLAGYEVREYLLERDGRQCAYCGRSAVPLQVDHVVAKRRSGSDRVSNLVLACEPCNRAKGGLPVEVFLAGQPEVLARVLSSLKRPLGDAAAVNATRLTLWRALAATRLSVEAASGGRTRWNRARCQVPKTHALDALCVGVVDAVRGWQSRPTLTITATGRGQHQRTRVTAAGFPRGYLSRRKIHGGFRTGDLVRATVPSGRHAGIHTGRLAVRASGYCNVQTATGTVQGIAARWCRLLQRADGYGYAVRAATFPPPTEIGGLHAVRSR
jgi:RRXRR protein/HNH endonuclease